MSCPVSGQTTQMVVVAPSLRGPSTESLLSVKGVWVVALGGDIVGGEETLVAGQEGQTVGGGV